MNFYFKCVVCGKTDKPLMKLLACSNCNGNLCIDYSAAPSSTVRLPLNEPKNLISLGEGTTPLVAMPYVAASLNLRNVLGKMEFLNPTGSFKDRGSSILVSAAREQGVLEFVDDSSGNAGASVAAYGARAGMRMHMFIPVQATGAKVEQIKAYGAQLHMIEGPRSAATEAAKAFVQKHPEFLYLPHALSPFFVEGMKSVAYELSHIGKENRCHIVLPVGNGALALGLYYGFQEVSLKTIPTIHCIQSLAVAPLVAKFHGKPVKSASPTTIAVGVAVNNPPRANEIVDAIRMSGGTAIAVPDSKITDWRALLARHEGILCEQTSAVAFAGLEILVAKGVVAPTDTVVVPITGSGLKDVAA